MDITFCCADTNADEWLPGLRAALPEATITLWQPGAPPARYAIVWQPPQQFFAEQPQLRALFNMGAGVDALMGPHLSPQTLVVRLNDAGMADQMADGGVRPVPQDRRVQPPLRHRHPPIHSSPSDQPSQTG